MLVAVLTETPMSRCEKPGTRHLSLPALILPAIQVNIQAGQLPAAEDNGDLLPQNSARHSVVQSSGVYNSPPWPTVNYCGERPCLKPLRAETGRRNPEAHWGAPERYATGEKVDLGVGVYRDADGQHTNPELPSRKAEQWLVDQPGKQILPGVQR